MKAYLVLDFAVHDLDGFRPYVERVPSFIERHGGSYIVRGAEPKPIEGIWSPERMVILEFPSRQNAEAFLSDPDFQELAKIRHRTTNSQLVLVDGCT
jgi:uncharacterized protein (DUF1330 family)